VKESTRRSSALRLSRRGHLRVDVDGVGRLTKHDLAVWIAAAIGLVALRRSAPSRSSAAASARARLLPSILRSTDKTTFWHALEPLRDPPDGAWP
jgi:hypothetical protein